jgi:transposase-like protein
VAARGKREYTDDDRAAVFLALTVNDGNVKRTARETGVPENTVRDWKTRWAKDGVPPEIEALAVGVAHEFADAAEGVRDKALRLLDGKLADMSGRDLAWVVGVLTDKVMRARGLDKKTVEHKHTLPTPDEVQALVAGFASGIREAAVARDEIIEGHVVEQAALPERSTPSP